jgi:hypothetical protein
MFKIIAIEEQNSEDLITDPNIALENAIEMLFDDKSCSMKECGYLGSVPLIEV